MNEDVVNVSEPTPSQGLAGALEGLVADSRLLSRCPASDRNAARLLSALLVSMFVYYWMVSGYTLSYAFGATSVGIAGCILGGLVCASMITAADTMIVRSVWVPRGLAALRRQSSFVNDVLQAGHWTDGLKGLFIPVLRAVFAVSGPIVFAIVLTLAFFKPDLQQEIITEYTRIHEGTFAAERALFDKQLDEWNSRLKDDSGQLKRLDEDEQASATTMRTAPPLVVSAEASDLAKRIDDLRKKHIDLEAEATRLSYDKACEGQGTRINCRNVTGQPGDGRAWQTLNEQLEAVNQQIQTIVAEIPMLESRLDKIRDPGAEERRIAVAAAQQRLGLIPTERAAIIEDMNTANKKIKEMTDDRREWVWQRVNQQFPISYGLSDRIAALDRLAEKNPSVWFFWRSLGIFLIFYELSPLIIAISARQYDHYGLRAASRYLLVAGTESAAVHRQAIALDTELAALERQRTAIYAPDDLVGTGSKSATGTPTESPARQLEEDPGASQTLDVDPPSGPPVASTMSEASEAARGETLSTRDADFSARPADAELLEKLRARPSSEPSILVPLPHRNHEAGSLTARAPRGDTNSADTRASSPKPAVNDATYEALKARWEVESMATPAARALIEALQRRPGRGEPIDLSSWPLVRPPEPSQDDTTTHQDVAAD